ncbi:MAG TPA: hypothetical protein VKR61_02665 [Bryobacteraceae bacterium]|nr:hypothetical protein [Bryobacteraceae bacterium]
MLRIAKATVLHAAHVLEISNAIGQLVAAARGAPGGFQNACAQKLRNILQLVPG